jgi:hypothetical protein
MTLRVVCLCVLSVLFTSVSLAHETKLIGNTQPYDGSRPDGHAPINVMGEHYHKKGEWMLSYRYMNMRMSGSRQGHNDVKNTDVLTDFPVTPTDMTSNMHMLSLMIAPSDRVTWI